ncbi:MAG: 50S ribosomal protein L32e [Candidatus Aenigmarchaeota archaeon]|nr:50S ribosomal protein L32e [Candidatus Aenigmarchaeota archaeon]
MDRQKHDITRQLKLRKVKKQAKPEFRRQEIHAQSTLKDVWRRPRGGESKLRKNQKARGSLPSPGYGSPRAARGLTRSGFRPVMVYTASDLQRMDKGRDIAVIGSTVGRKKRFEIATAAEEGGLQVLNFRKK